MTAIAASGGAVLVMAAVAYFVWAFETTPSDQVVVSNPVFNAARTRAPRFARTLQTAPPRPATATQRMLQIPPVSPIKSPSCARSSNS